MRNSNFVDTRCCEGEEEGVCDEGGGGEDEEETQLGSPGATLLVAIFEKYHISPLGMFKTLYFCHPELLINRLSWQIGGGGRRRGS